MAIIEEADSDDDVLQDDANLNPDGHPSANKITYAARTYALEQLLCSRKPVKAADFDALHGAGNAEELVQDLCDCTERLLHGTSLDEVDINRLERIAEIINFLGTANCEVAALVSLVSLFKILCEALLIPTEFMSEDYAITPEISQFHLYWSSGATAVLQVMANLQKIDSVHAKIRQDTEKASAVVIAASRFTARSKNRAEAPWTNQLSSLTAAAILARFTFSESELRDVAKHILLNHLKPLFSSTPHPSLHPETARSLPRIRGGDLFSDTWSESLWKGKSKEGEALGAVGCWKVLAYVIGMPKQADMENMWPLLVPPLLTMLDDHENRYRREGIECLDLFLATCPGQLLHRTGLGELIQKSLFTTYSFTSTSENIPMIRTALSAHLQLLDLLFPASSLEGSPLHSLQKTTSRTVKAKEPSALSRFNALCEIYHSIVINIFAYCSTSIPFMTLSFSVIPTMVDKLGVTYIRFLSDTLPVLCTCIGGTKAQRQMGSLILTKETVDMRIAATRALAAIVQVCEGTGRIDKWRGMILSHIATFWVFWEEMDAPRREAMNVVEVEQALGQLLRALIRGGGAAAKKDLERVAALDQILFQPLVVLHSEA